MKRNAAKLPVGRSYGSAISSASLLSLRLHHAVHFHPKCQTNLPEGRRRRGWFLSVAAGMSAYVHILPYCMFNHINCILNLDTAVSTVLSDSHVNIRSCHLIPTLWYISIWCHGVLSDYHIMSYLCTMQNYITSHDQDMSHVLQYCEMEHIIASYHTISYHVKLDHVYCMSYSTKSDCIISYHIQYDLTGMSISISYVAMISWALGHPMNL